MSLQLPDSGAETLPDGRRLPASAQRNSGPILALLQGLGLKGRLLEIASGSGLHAAQMAPVLGMMWQPSDVDPANLTSIRAWSATTQADILPPILLDATRPGWAKTLPPQDAILLVNLLHLIPTQSAIHLLAELPHALAPNGTACLYGPFLRDGDHVSEGDAAFDGSLRAQDSTIGYKDLAWVTDQLAKAGMTTKVTPMPANNLMLVAQHSNSII